MSTCIWFLGWGWLNRGWGCLVTGPSPVGSRCLAKPLSATLQWTLAGHIASSEDLSNGKLEGGLHGFAIHPHVSNVDMLLTLCGAAPLPSLGGTITS